MKLTAEQELILETVRTTTDNLAIEARAGGAKTTTLVKIAEALPGKTILALAFNKKIAVEMTERLPSNAESKTLNALGDKAIREFRGKFHKIEDKKCFEILQSLIRQLDPEDQEELYDRFAETLQAIKTAKNAGYVPDGAHPMMRSLLDASDFFANLDEEPSELQQQIINKALRTSLKMALDEGFLDFADQIYISALHRSISFPRFEVLLVDEAQDLSALNHTMLGKMVKGSTRLIIVGDPCQAIYAFRGADEESMSRLSQRFDMKTLYLTVCFRCAPEIVENVRWRAPDMTAFPTTPSGEVRRHDTWNLSQIGDGDAVICRNNAPLFSLAVKLLGAGRSPELYSGDIVPGLVKIMKKLGKQDIPTTEAKQALAEWKDKETERSRSPGAVQDKYECIMIFLESNSTLGDAIRRIEEIAAMSGRIKLMTGHKSKGLEFDHVWFLDQHLCKPKGQDRNVKYVIETRARRQLNYIESDKLVGV